MNEEREFAEIKTTNWWRMVLREVESYRNSCVSRICTAKDLREVYIEQGRVDALRRIMNIISGFSNNEED